MVDFAQRGCDPASSGFFERVSRNQRAPGRLISRRAIYFSASKSLYSELQMIRSGRHFLQIPGPTNVPDRVLRAMHQPVMDHRGAEFSKLASEALENLRPIFRTGGHVIMYPASGTGAWEAAIVNTLSPGDRVLMFETGHFSNLWRQ